MTSFCPISAESSSGRGCSKERTLPVTGCTKETKAECKACMEGREIAEGSSTSLFDGFEVSSEAEEPVIEESIDE